MSLAWLCALDLACGAHEVHTCWRYRFMEAAVHVVHSSVHMQL